MDSHVYEQVLQAPRDIRHVLLHSSLCCKCFQWFWMRLNPKWEWIFYSFKTINYIWLWLFYSLIHPELIEPFEAGSYQEKLQKQIDWKFLAFFQEVGGLCKNIREYLAWKQQLIFISIPQNATQEIYSYSISIFQFLQSNLPTFHEKVWKVCISHEYVKILHLWLAWHIFNGYHISHSIACLVQNCQEKHEIQGQDKAFWHLYWQMNEVGVICSWKQSVHRSRQKGARRRGGNYHDTNSIKYKMQG